MLNHITQILNYVVESFIHIWPYLLITIPIAVAVWNWQLTSVSRQKWKSGAFSYLTMQGGVLASEVETRSGGGGTSESGGSGPSVVWTASGSGSPRSRR